MSGQLICGKTEITNSVQAVRVNADGHLLTSGGGGSGGTQYDVGTALPSDATGTVALVKDAVGNAGAMELTAGGALRTSTAGLTVGSDATLLTAQQVLCYGRDSSGTLDVLKTDAQGHLETVADYETTTTSIFSGTQVIPASSSHTFPTGYLKNGSAEYSIYIISTTTPADIDYTITATYSDDDSTYYSDGGILGVSVMAVANSASHFNKTPDKYVKITVTNNSTTNSLTITSVKGNRVNGI